MQIGADTYYYFDMTVRDAPAYCTQLAYARTDETYAFIKHVSCHFIDYVLTGHGTITCGTETRTVGPGDMIYVRPNTYISYRADPHDPYEKLWMSMYGTMIDDMANHMLGDRSVIVVNSAVAAPIHRLIRETQQNGMTDESFLNCLVALFVQLSKAEYSQRVGMAGEIRAWINDHLGVRCTLDDIAAYFHISKRHMIRLFKEAYNQTPGAYRSEARLISATHYLSETTLSVGEIASILGFCDQSFFSTAFKKRFGVYPLAYRNNKL